MTHVPTPADQKLALALAESDARLDQERREIEASEDEQLEKIGKRIDRCKAQGVAAMLKIGEQLSAAHDLFAGAGRDGEFRPWVKRRCYFSLRTAYRYRDVHRRFAGQKCATVAHFEQRALYCLAKEDCPQEAVDKAIEMADRGERITLHAAQLLLKDHVEVVEAVDDYGDDDHVDTTNGDEDPGNVTVGDRSDAPVVVNGTPGNFSADIVTADDDTLGSEDDHVGRDNGVGLKQLQDAYEQHIVPQLEVASKPVRQKFLRWAADMWH
jgi:hypothetical protein